MGRGPLPLRERNCPVLSPGPPSPPSPPSPYWSACVLPTLLGQPPFPALSPGPTMSAPCLPLSLAPMLQVAPPPPHSCPVSRPYNVGPLSFPVSGPYVTGHPPSPPFLPCHQALQALPGRARLPCPVSKPYQLSQVGPSSPDLASGFTS